MQSNNNGFAMLKIPKTPSLMKFFDQLERLERLHLLIKRKATGTPKQLAHRLAVSERSIYQFLKVLKEKGAPIEFDRERNSYYYQSEFHFSIEIG